jgi:uncharacterized protein (TIGR02996 family)
VLLPDEEQPAGAVRMRRDGKPTRYADLDAAGGRIPTDKAVAKRVDLITLPEGVEGTNCGNCRWAPGEDGLCKNTQIRQPVNGRNCCAKWDAPGVLRAFKMSRRAFWTHPAVGRDGQPRRYDLASGWIAPDSTFHAMPHGQLHGEWAAKHLGIADPSEAFDTLHRRGWARVAAPGHFGQGDLYKITTHSLKASGPRDRIAEFLHSLPPNQEVQVGDSAWQHYRGGAHEVVRRLFGEGHFRRRGRPTQYVGEVARNPAPAQPAHWRAPAGGVVVRGNYYQGGKLVPGEASGHPVKPKKKRLSGLLRELRSALVVKYAASPSKVAILREASIARRAWMLGQRSSCRFGDCTGVSKMLAHGLQQAGIPAKVTGGYFHATDGRFGDPPSPWEHTWVELGDGTIVDPTADQFASSADVGLPKVFIGGRDHPLSERYRHFPDWPEAFGPSEDEAHPDRMARRYADRTTDDEAFRNAIDEAPHDDAPKLVYADYLDERGRSTEADIWRQMAAAKGDEELHPKGVLFTIHRTAPENYPHTAEGSTDERLLDLLHDRRQPYKAHSISHRGGVHYTYVSDPTGPFSGQHRDASSMVGHVRRLDREARRITGGSGAIDNFDPSIAFPVSPEDRKHSRFRAVTSSIPRGYGPAGPIHIPTAHADYLVGEPTAVHDLVHEIRHGEQRPAV